MNIEYRMLQESNKILRRELEQAQEIILCRENEEAAVLPENMSLEEFVGALRRELEQAQAIAKRALAQGAETRDKAVAALQQRDEAMATADTRAAAHTLELSFSEEVAQCWFERYHAAHELSGQEPEDHRLPEYITGLKEDLAEVRDLLEQAWKFVAYDGAEESNWFKETEDLLYP